MRNINGNFVIGATGSLHGKSNIFVSVFVRQQPEILKNRADSLANVVHLGRTQSVYVNRLEKNLAFGRFLLGQNPFDQRCFAGAGVADNRHNSPGSILKLTSLSATESSAYIFETLLKWIIPIYE